jgi:hypothetical protein
MGLGIGDGLFLPAAVVEGMPHFVEVPFFVLLVLEDLDPVIRDAHAQAVIKAQSALFYLATGSWHAAHILRNAEAIGFEGVDEVVGQLQISDGIPLGSFLEVFVVVIKANSLTMMEIKHGSYAVKTVAIKVKFLEPVGHVGEEKLLYFPLAIVKEFGSPNQCVLLCRRGENIDPLSHRTH